MIGDRYGPYLLMAAMDPGRLGQVYLARDERTGRDVVVRVLPEGFLADDAARKRFRQAVLALYRLHHEGIADTLDVVNEDGRDVVVTEFVRGETLAAMLKRGRLTEATAARTTRDLAEALAAGHERGVMHRFLNPRNVMVRGDGSVVIMDFGLPRSGSGAENAAPPNVTSLPLDRLAYAAPEQLSGTRGDGRSDLYSLGVMFYEMLTGERPHDSPDAASLAYQITHVPAPPPSRFHRLLSRPLEHIVLMCLETDPGRRILSGHDLAADLRRLEMQAAARRADHPMDRANQVWSIVLSVLLSGAVAAALLLANVGRSRERLFDLMFTGHTGVLSGEVRSIAMMPLRDIGHAEGSEPLGDGMAIEISRLLGAVHALKVVGPSSAARTRVNPDSLTRLGRALLVDVVVSGTISQPTPNTMRVSLRARQCATERLVWTRTSEMRFDEALDLERDMVLSLLRALRVPMTNDEGLRIGITRPVTRPAYTAYLIGRGLMERGDGASRGNARDYLERSVRLDSTAAPAWAALATLALLAHRGDWRLPDAGDCMRIKTPALRAFAIDATNAAAHAAYGYAQWRCDRQMPEAEQHFRVALAAQPGDPLAHAAFAEFLGAQDRFEERLVQTRKAMELDPMSPAIHVDLARCYLYLHQSDRATRQCLRALELDPRDATAWAALARIQAVRGTWDDALASQRTADSLGGVPGARWMQLRAAAAAGQRVQAQRLWRAQQDLMSLGEADAFQAAIASLAMGDRSGATSWLAHAVGAGVLTAQDLRMAPELDPLRGEERFDALFARVTAGEGVEPPAQ